MPTRRASCPRDEHGNPCEPKTRTWYYEWPLPGDFEKRVKAHLDWIAANPEVAEAQTMIMYSWNEFLEGGGICPTMGTSPDYKPVTTLLDEVTKALKDWKYPQGSQKRHVHSQ